MDKRLRIIILAAVLIGCAVLIAGCSSPTPTPAGNATPTAVPANTIVSMEYGAPVSLDFMTDDGYDTASMEIYQNTYDTLYYYDGNDTTKPVPRLATGYDLSADGLVYTFYLRPNVTFHDGTAFNASAVKYSLDRLFLIDQPPASSNFIGTVKGYSAYHANQTNTTQADVDAYLAKKGVEVVNDTCVKVTLESPNSNFIMMLTFTATSIMSPTYDQAHGGYSAIDHKGNEYMIDHACGTGPFILDSMVAGQPIILVRNDNYFRGPAKSQRVIIQEVKDWNTRFLALQKGEADFITVDAVHAPEVKSAGGNSALAEFGGLATTPIQFNYAFWPYNIKEVRQAITELFDKDQFIASLNGYAIRRDQAIPKGEIGGDMNVTQKYDPTNAVKLLNAAGFTPANKTNLVIDYNSGNENRKRAAMMLADAINAVENQTGIHMEAQNVDWTKEVPLMNAGKIPIYIVGWQADYPGSDNFVSCFYWSGGKYASQNSIPANKTIDDLFKQSLMETSPTKQAQLYQQIVEISNADYQYCYLYQAVDTVGYNKNLKGVSFNPLNGGIYVNYYDVYK